MQFSAVAAIFLAALAAADAATIPAEHHARFLSEKDTIAAELAAWKQSEAGIYAKANGLFKDTISIQSTGPSDEQLTRFFMSKLTVEKAQAENPEATFSTDSPFSLMTEAEFKAYVARSTPLGANNTFFRGTAAENIEVADIQPAATSVDWTSGGCVAAVKNQGSCGSCWAFSAIGALESAVCIKKGSLKLLSEQQVTSCDTTSQGCNGGWQTNALNYIKKSGICSSANYPYASGSSGATGACKACSSKEAITISAVTKVSATDAALTAAITKQPVAVAVAAGGSVWKQYKSGIVSTCDTTQLDHAVLAVGFDGTSYRLRNQWGTSWGNKGFIQLSRSGGKASCGVINSNNAYPVVA